MKSGDKCYTFFVHIGYVTPKNRILRAAQRLSPQSQNQNLIYQRGVTGVLDVIRIVQKIVQRSIIRDVQTLSTILSLPRRFGTGNIIKMLIMKRSLPQT